MATVATKKFTKRQDLLSVAHARQQPILFWLSYTFHQEPSRTRIVPTIYISDFT